VPRLLLWGLDGADWRILNPLLDQGAMPNLAALIERGVMGKLYHPLPSISAMRWTTIATGAPPERHGVLTETEAEPRGGGRRPVSVNARCVTAVWNILERRGARVHVVGWPASHPAESLHGAAVSNLFAWPSAGPGAPWPIVPGSVAPPELAGRLAEFRVHPGDLTGDDLLPFLPNLAAIDQSRDGRPLQLAAALAETITYHGAATWLLENEPWDFVAVHYPLLGRVEGASPFADMLLGRLVELAGPDTFILIVSAHGLFCLSGPGVRKDALIYGATALDVTPTILACFGAPPALDMPGRVLAEAFEQPPALERVATWETEAPKPDDAAVEQALSALAAAGYTDPLAERVREQDARTEAERRLHLAWVHLAAGRGGPAVELLEQLERTDSVAPYLAYAYLLCRRLEDCRAALDSLRDPPPMAALVRGRMLFLEGRTEEALDALDVVEHDERSAPVALCLAGDIYSSAGRSGEAERCYAAALDRDPSCAPAHLGRARVLLVRGDAEAAAEAALSAVQSRYDLAPAHLVLGAALARLGMTDGAASALENCLKLDPGNAVARRWLRARR